MCYPDADARPDPMPWWPVLTWMGVVLVVVLGCAAMVVQLEAEAQADIAAERHEAYVQGDLDARAALRDEMVDMLVRAREQGEREGAQSACRSQP